MDVGSEESSVEVKEPEKPVVDVKAGILETRVLGVAFRVALQNCRNTRECENINAISAFSK